MTARNLSTARIAVLMLVLGAVAGACSDGPTAPGESGNWKKGTALHAVIVGSITRSFTLHVPPTTRRGAGGTTVPYPLVLVLHGSAAVGSAIEEASKMDSLADAAVFLVAYPNATGGRFNVYASDWNAGTCCGGANRDGVDDIGFLSALIQHTAANLPVDTKRIYVAGFSAGGRMAYYAGCKLSTTIAAIGVVSGSLVDDSCQPTKAVSLWAVHGTDDAEVLFDEPSATPPPRRFPGEADQLPPAVQFWTALVRCTGGTTKLTSPNVRQALFSGCVGADVEFNTINGGTHGWPGGPDDPGARPPMNELNASLAMWTFFSKHVRN